MFAMGLTVIFDELLVKIKEPIELFNNCNARQTGLYNND